MRSIPPIHLLAALAMIPVLCPAQDMRENLQQAIEAVVEQMEQDDGDAPQADAAEDGAEAAPEPGPDLSGLAREELGEKLGDESSAVRDAAQAALRAMFGESREEMMDFCFELFRDTPDPEIRMRCRELMIESIASGIGGPDGRGFVGILLNLHGFFDRNGELIFGVRVMELVPDAPAAAAGMLPGDLIVKIDDLDVSGRNGDRIFQDYVAAKRPGTKVRLSIIRGDEPVNIELALARRPDMGPPPPTPDPEQVFRDWLRQRLQPAEE